MKRRSRSDNRSERSVEPGARDRQSVMFSNQRHHTGPTEDDRSNYSRMTSMSSQRTSVRAPSLLEASRHRLSIRKLAAFPMQQTAPKPFLACCSDITRYGRDWNAEFQLAWEMDDSTVPQAESRMETLRRIEREFVDAAIRTARQIVTLDDDGPRELPKFLQCYRVDNIFFRVLPDSRSGRNYVASLRGVLQSRTRLLTVPLSCMIFYRGMPVLAQALVPMPPNPTRLYGADSTNDKEVEAEIIHMADALNIPFPDGTLEVYEGLDGRLYLTNSNSTLTPLFVDDTIMKRQEMLRLCCNVTDGHGDTISLLGNAEALNRIVQACVDSESRAVGERLKKLCDVLHSIGINMCLLKQVLCKAEESGMFPPHVLSRLRELVSIEMLARSVKQEFYLEVQGKRVAYDDEALAGTLSKHIAMVFAKLENFRSLFLEVVAKKYGIVDLDEDIIDSLTSVRTGMKADILARICALIGVSIEKTSQNGTIMKWHAHVNARVLPNLIDPQYVRALSEKYKTVPMKDSFRYAFCLPVRWKVACWDKAYEEALTLVRETMRAQDEISGKVSMPTLHSRRSVCEVCFATMQKNYMAEGRHMFSEAMKGFEKMTGPVTQGRLHIEYGFWLLRVVELYQTDEPATYRACVEEAAGHFFSAIHKLPSYLKSEHGAWLHLQPYKGLLQCKQLLPSCSVNTGELVEHSIELSTIGWASDFFVYYLWDLSLQLESEGRYEDAIRVLLTAITISKKKPTESLDMPSLLTDGAHIYRSWDREKYAEHCMTLLREAGDKAAELFGTHSREYAVVQNNRGAIEIDINRLQNAKESLDKAGDAFIKAGVPETDTDYLAYLDNRKCLEQRLSARPVVYRGILQRYPFLATRGDKFPFGDVRLLEDEIFVELAHKRARIEDDTLESRQLEQAMKERMWELHRSIQEGNVLKRYPFLRAEIHGVHIATLRLEDDAFFMELVRQLGPGADATRINEVEHAVGEYVAHKARNVAMERAYVDRLEQDFSDTYEAYVNLKLPIPWIYILEDERVITLIDQIHKCSKSSGASVDLMQAQRQLGACVEEIERECFQWRKELAPWLSSSKRYSVSARDLAGDTHLNDLLCMRRLCASRGDANEKRLDVLLSEKLNAMWERAYTVRSLLAVDDEELHREFPFLDERPHHQRLSTLRIYEDPVVANLVERFRNGSGDGQLQAEMVVAVNYLAASHCDDKELRGLNYDMEGFTSGKFTIDTIPHMYDDYYMVLSQRRNDEAKSHTDDSPAAWELTHQMEQRVLQINSWARKVNANSYRKRQRLEGKYPFINRRHLGFTLDMLDVEVDDEFMSLVAARQQLTGIKPVALAALNRFSDQANQHVTELARRRINCMKEHQTKYPFIPSKMEGINTSTIYLGESKTFAQKAEQYSKIMLSKESNPELRQKRLVREMLNQVLAIARELNMRQNRLAIESEDLRERYPFLPDEPVDGILLVDVRPTQHPEFRTLSNQLDELRRDPVGNAAEIGAVEEKARALVVGLAEASAAATEAVRHQYPFLPKRVLGVPVGELPIGKDEVFTTLKGGDLSANKATLYSRAVQLVFNLHLSDAQLADADDAALSANPFLIYTTRKCFPLRHLRLQEDAIFTQLLDEYNTLLQRVCVDEEAAANARLRLATRADELALQEIKKVEEIRQAFHEIQSLTLEDIQLLERRGVLEQIKKSGTEGCTAALLDDVQKILEDDRKERIAKVQQMDEMRKMYPMLGRNADPSMLHNPDVAKLVGDHDELIEDISKNAGKLQQIKDQITRKAEVIKTMSPRNIKEREQPNEITESRSLTDIEEQVNEYIREDGYYKDLQRQYQEVQDKGVETNGPIMRSLNSRMETRKDQVRQAFLKDSAFQDRERRRLLKKFKGIDDKCEGKSVLLQKLEDDETMKHLMRQQKSMTTNSPQEGNIERLKEQRIQEIIKQHQAEEDSLVAAYPFLGRFVKGIPVGDLNLMADPEFANLASQYTRAATSGDAARCAQLKQALLEIASRTARDVRRGRLRRAVRAEGLRERYPFLPDEPVDGILLVDVRPTQHPEFRTLSNQLDELRRDPVGNAAEIGAVEEKARALVVGLAEASAAATEAVRHQYPFLPKRVLGVPVGELPIHDDAVLLQLEKRRTSEGKAAGAVEEEILKRVEELARDARVADRDRGEANEYVRACNPFLVYEDRKCVLLSDIPLGDDSLYQQLLGERLSALGNVEADADHLKRIEDALCSRADELALNELVKCMLLGKYPFLGSEDTDGLSSRLARDEEFQKMCARYDELMSDPVKNEEALQELERSMKERRRASAEEEAADLKRRGSSYYSGKIGASLSACALLPDTFRTVPLQELYLEDDPFFQEILVRYRELVSNDRKPETPLEKQLYEQLYRRAEQVAGDVLMHRALEERETARSTSRYPFLDSSLLNVCSRTMAFDDDELFCEHLKLYEDEAAKGPGVAGREKLNETKAQLNNRLRVMMETHQAEEDSLVAAYPFLGRFVKGIPVGDLNLMADPEFANLASQYTRAATSGDAARCAQLKQALLEIASRTARDVRRGRLRRAVRAEGLRERYPFLPDEPVDGILLVDVRPTQHPEFRTLSNQLDELRRDPVGNAAEIGAVEEKARALVVGLAEASAAATEAVRHQYPFLPKRVLGVPVGELPIHDDAVLLQLEKRRTSEGKAAGAVEEEILKRVEELARDARVADRDRGEANEYVRACNPFLVYEDRKCVLLSDIPLGDDSLYQQLLGERLSALGNVEADADHLKRIEDALCSRADELALNELVKCMLLGKYPFLGSEDTDGLSSRLARDEEFQKMCARYDELMSDPVKNEEALQELERSMKERRRASAEEEAADLKRRGSSYYSGKIGASLSACALLPDTFRTVPLQELYLEDDPFFQEILVRYRELVSNDRKPETPLEKQLYEQLYRRAEQVAGDVLMHRALEERETARSTSRYPFLDSSLLNVCSRTMAFDDDELFCEHLKLYEDEAAKGPGVAGREKLNETKAQLNNRLRVMMETHQAEEDSLVAAYPFLGRFVKGIPVGDLNLMADPEFANLASQYTRAATSGDAARCAQLKQALLEIASRTARDVRRGRLRRAVRAEGLRERYPFLPDEPVDGILLVDVRPTQHPEFRTLSNQLDELRRDPVGNAAEIGAVEEKARALVVGLAEASAAATEAVRHQYPFLPKRVLGVPVGELPIHDDAVLLQLEKRRTSEGKAAGAVEEEILKRVEELARDARVADRDRGEANEYVRACNPFLVYEDRKCVLLSDIPLGDDSLYQQLLGERLSALGNVEADADHLKRIEDALCSRADELALNELVKCMLLGKYPFLGSEDTDGLSSRLARDEEFQKMCARYDELMSDPVKNEEALQELERSMKERRRASAEEEAADLKRRGSSYYSGKIGASLSACALLPDTFRTVPLQELYLEDDPFFQEILVRYRELVSNDRKPETPLEKQLYEQLYRRAEQVAGDVLMHRALEERETARSTSRYPFLDSSLLNVCSRTMAFDDDELFCEHLKLYEDEAAKGPGVAGREKLNETKAQLNNRLRVMMETHQAEEDSLVAAYPFLGRFVKGIPVGDLNLMADPEFANLASQYTRAATSGDAARCAQLKQALLEIASRTARDVRRGRLRRAVRAEGLRERYPFLPDEPVDGILLVDVRPTQHPEFRTLSNQLDELRRDPVGNAAEIGAVEEKARALVVGLAEASAAATEAVRHQYPFLPKRVLGVPVGELPIHDDAVLLQLGRRRLRQRKCSGNFKGCTAVEEEILKRVEELARDARVADRDRGEANEYVRACNPFLVYEDRKCVLLSDIPLGDDSLYQQLLGERLSALGNVEADADHLKRIEDALCSRADELALNELVKCMLLRKYPFLGSEDTDGLSSRLARDEEFQKMCARYDELMSDPVKNEEALQELERSMKERVASFANSPKDSDGCGAVISFDLLRDPFISSADAGGVQASFGGGTLASLNSSPQKVRLTSFEADPNERLSSVTLLPYGNAMECFKEAEVVSFDICMKRRDHKPRKAKRKKAHSLGGEAGGLGANEDVVGEDDTEDAGTRDGDTIDDNVAPAVREGGDTVSDRGDLSLLEVGELKEAGAGAAGSECVGNEERVTSAASEKLEEIVDSASTKEGAAAEGKPVGDDNLAARGTEEGATAEGKPVGDDNLAARGTEEGATAEGKPVGDDNLAARGTEEGATAEGKPVGDDNLAARGTEEGATAEGKPVGDDSLAARGTEEGATAEGATAEEGDTILGQEDETLACALRLEALRANIEELLVLESSSRAFHEKDERYERDQIMLAASDEARIIENERWARERLQHLVDDEEPPARNEVHVEEEDERRKLKQQEKLVLNFVRDIMLLKERETRERRACENDERIHLKGITTAAEESLQDALAAQKERETEESAVQKEGQRQEASSLIKSVIFAYRARRRLANRFRNRKAYTQKNAIEDLYGVEHNERLAIINEEKAALEELFRLGDFWDQKSEEESRKEFVELEKEEGLARHELIDDFMFQLKNLQRAYRKVVTKHQEATPSLQDLMRFEAREDALRAGVQCDASDTSFAGAQEDAVEVPGVERSDEMEGDYDECLSSGRYKGYVLDAIGSFLLKYERDLRKFRAVLERNKAGIAVEHELLKKSRDNATQDVAHGGSGASWVPTRPLPLSDLVRGPSAQYRRGRIADARGNKPVSGLNGVDRRTATAVDTARIGSSRKTR